MLVLTSKHQLKKLYIVLDKKHVLYHFISFNICNYFGQLVHMSTNITGHDIASMK